MNGQPQQDPELTYRDPMAYIAWLRTRGLNPMQIDNLMRQRFGPGQTPEQRQQQKQKSSETAAYGQAAGLVGGAVASRYIMNNAGKWIDQITGAEVPANTVAQTTSTLPTSGITATPTTQAQWNAGADAATAAQPQIISTQGNMSTVQTPAGPQQVPTESLNDPGFWNNVNWGKVMQGGLSLYQMYGAYQSYKSGDKTGAAIQGLAGAGNLAAATGAVATGAGAGTTGAYVIPGLNILAGGYSGYQTAQAIGDMAAGKQRYRTGALGMAGAGAAIGSVIPGVGTAVGAAVGALAGLTAAKFGSSKGKGQVQRDAIRSALQEQGILDENFQGTLADGSVTDFGQDGSKLNTKAMNKLRSENPNAFEQAQQLGDAMAASYGFMGDKARSLARLYVRGALSNAKDDPNIALANMQHFAKQQGITSELLQNNLNDALKKERIDQGEYNRLLSAGQQLIGASPQMQQAQPIPRPPKGEVARQSAGLYRDDKGKLIAAQNMRAALNRAYNNTKQTKEKK